MSVSKFATRNFKGVPLCYYSIESEHVDTSVTTAKRAPSHHILCIDVSGSMYSDLTALKPMVEKLLTLEEFNNPDLSVSLLSYSSSGDVRVHFERATVAQVMAPNSAQLQEIRNLRVRGLTCISQGLRAAEKLINDAEMTCISLHSDGFANDTSPMAERRDILAAIDALKAHPNMFVNTVAYGSWADFGTLSLIANELSGTCLQATDIRQVYSAMHDATATLAGNMAPVVEIPIGGAAHVLVVAGSSGKVLGSTDTLTVRGIKAGEGVTAYRLHELTADEYANFDAPEATMLTANGPGVLAFARTQLAQGNLNTAKYALVAYNNQDLLAEHYRALTNSDVAAMASAMDLHLFKNPAVKFSTNTPYGLPVQGASVLSVLSVLAEYRHSLRVNLTELKSGYKRRGLQRVPGTRLEDGTLLLPPTRLQANGPYDAVPVNAIEINRNTATINLRTARPAVLVDDRVGNDGAVIQEVMGVKLDLKEYRNYTLVGDGSLNVDSLVLRIGDKRCFKALADLDVVSGTFDPTAPYTIVLKGRPLVDFDQSFDVKAGTFEQLAQLTVLSKILSAVTAGSSEALTPEQIAALKEVNVTSGGYFSAPTTNTYTDLKEALAKGLVDTRLSYKVELGTLDITNIGNLKSGNAYFERRFTLTGPDGEVAKPKLPMVLEPGMKVGLKKLSARTKLDAVDALTFPIYEDFFGLADNGSVRSILGYAGLGTGAEIAFLDACADTMPVDERLAVFTTVLKDVDAAIDNIYKTVISPLAFYVGATGLVPDDLASVGVNAELLQASYPSVKLSKGEKEEGMFYMLPSGHLLTVYTTGEHFTTEAGYTTAA